MTAAYGRDWVGYGPNPPDPRWPSDAKLAVQFVINYEEGGEHSLLHGDRRSEGFVTEEPTAPLVGRRSLNVESQYEYGSRAGFWRLHRLFTDRSIPVTIFGTAMALARNPDAVAAMKAANWEIASHGYRWIDYQELPPDVERLHLKKAIELHEAVTGERPQGWYQGRTSRSSRRLLAEEGGFVYDSDSFGDDLPYWVREFGVPQLVVPYTLDNNDVRFAHPYAFGGVDFAEYLTSAFEFLLREGESSPKMMSIGLHCRLAGRPGRAAVLERFLDRVIRADAVWITRRIDIARHWIDHHPMEDRTEVTKTSTSTVDPAAAQRGGRTRDGIVS
jgi:putative urate catabolism protein